MTVSITSLKIQYDDALTAMILADELALRGHPEGRVQAEIDRDAAADNADHCVREILLKNPTDSVELKTKQELWLNHGKDILEMYPDEIYRHF